MDALGAAKLFSAFEKLVRLVRLALAYTAGKMSGKKQERERQKKAADEVQEKWDKIDSADVDLHSAADSLRSRWDADNKKPDA